MVGGGPAGLEAARVSAERGFDVILFEAAVNLGGQLRLAAKARTRRQIRGVADWLISEVQALGVDIRTAAYAEIDEITTETPDLVIIATDGALRLPAYAGAELAISDWEAISGAPVGGEILHYDETDAHPAGV